MHGCFGSLQILKNYILLAASVVKLNQWRYPPICLSQVAVTMSVAGSVGDILPIIGDGPLYPNSNRYITGGVAYGSFRTTPPPPDTFTDRAKAGWTVGSGVEYGFAGPWSAKLEYLYADLGKQRCASASCTAAGGIDVTLKTHMVRSGLNYHFTGLPF